MEFIKTIEEILGKKAIYNFLPMQQGDVKITWLISSLLKELTNYYKPNTDFKDGITRY